MASRLIEGASFVYGGSFGGIDAWDSPTAGPVLGADAFGPRVARASVTLAPATGAGAAALGLRGVTSATLASATAIGRGRRVVSPGAARTTRAGARGGLAAATTRGASASAAIRAKGAVSPAAVRRVSASDRG